MSASAALPPHRNAPDPAGIRRFGLAFGLATAAALGAALLLPTPLAPPTARFLGPARPAQEQATASLERAAAQRPEDVELLRRLAAQLRDSRRLPELAATLERLHALTAAPAPLREAMSLRLALGDAAAARAALERLATLGATTDQESLSLAALRMEAADPAGAFAGLLAALQRSQTPELALRAMQAAARLPDPAMAMRPLGALLGNAAPDLMEALRRVLMKEGRPDLALYLLEGLPPEAQATPRLALAMAEAEARAGWAGSALARLMALRATEGLPPGGGALLVDLALREGQVEEAFAVAALLPPEAWPAALPLRLHQAARAARDPTLFRRLEPARLAARPDAAAVVALARGDRAAARRFAQQAVETPPDSAEGARGVAAVLRELGQDQAAHDRLRRLAQQEAPDSAALRLFAELAALPARRAPALALLARHRLSGPAAGEAWLRLALAEGQAQAVADFLRQGGTASAAGLVEVLALAARQRAPALAEAAATPLRSLRDLPEGWTEEEVAVTAALSRPLTPTGLLAALNLLAWAGEAAARDRVVGLLAVAPELAAAATSLPGAAQHQALPRLRREAAGAGEAATARLALLAVLAPAQALPLLETRAAAEPARFGAALALALLRTEGAEAGVAALGDLLPRLLRPQQEQALFLLLAAAPEPAQAPLARLAAQTLGPTWRRSYETALERQGRRAELLAALRARAAQSAPAERAAIAARLAAMGDSAGAAALRAEEEANP